MLLQALLLLHHHRRTEEYFLLLRFSAGSRTRLFMLWTSLSLFWLIKEQFWSRTYSNVPSSAASLVSSSWRVSSDTAVPAAWISYNKVITHVTLNESHQWVQSFNFHKVWQNSSPQQANKLAGERSKQIFMNKDNCIWDEISITHQ